MGKARFQQPQVALGVIPGILSYLGSALLPLGKALPRSAFDFYFAQGQCSDRNPAASVPAGVRTGGSSPGKCCPNMSTGRKMARLPEHPECQAHSTSPWPCSFLTAVRGHN